MSNLIKYEQRRFIKGQLLTEEDLNAVWDYLVPQDRLTRISLVGAGVFYGLNIVKNKDMSITVSKGAGVSSEGHLFFLEKDQIFYFQRSYTTIANQPNTGFPLRLLNSTVPANSKAFEFATEPLTGSLPETIPDNFCFVLYYQESSSGSGSGNCFTSFNQEGAKVTYELRLLALSETDLDKVWLHQPESGTNTGVPNHFPYVERLKLWDLVKDKKPSKPEEEPPNVTLTELQTAYKVLIDKAVQDGNTEGLITALVRALFDQATADNFKEIITSFPPEYYQYLHDYLKDIVAAYEEWVMSNPDPERILWCPNQGDFPKFIALGPDPACRMKRYYPGIPGEGAAGVLDALKARLEAIVKPASTQFQALNANSEIKITASRHKHPPLSEQAIPYYYKNDVIRPLWSPALSAAQRTDDIPSYFPHPPLSTKPFDQPFYYDLEKYDFFRVEGHIGQSLEAGFKAIFDKRAEYNLPFDILLVRIGPAVPINEETPIDPLAAYLHQLNFTEFVKERPGLEHMGGVPKGGTLVLLYQESGTGKVFFTHTSDKRLQAVRVDINRTIVADFCLPYSCFKGPDIKYYIIEETLPPAQSPIALFTERSRAYQTTTPVLKESDKGQANVSISLTLDNQSLNANTYKWQIDNADVSGSPSDGADFTIQNQSLNEKQALEVSLTAGKPGTPGASLKQVIDLCPQELSLFFLDNGVERAEMAVFIGDKFNFGTPIPINASPAGGVLLYDNTFEIVRNNQIIKKGEITGSNGTFNLQLNDSITSGTYTLRYRFCEGVERQIRLIVTRPQFEADAPLVVLRQATFAGNIQEAPGTEIKNTAAYIKTEQFIQTAYTDSGVLTHDFEAVVRAIAGKLGSADTSVQTAYGTLLRNASWAFLDGIVGLSEGNDLSDSLKSAVENLKPILARAGTSGASLARDWNGKALQNKGNKALISIIENLLKK